MEMESNRELEMDGITPDVRVFDIFHPTPVPLKELSAITVSLEIWRCKANEYRTKAKLKEFCPSGERIVLKQILPDLPSVIYTAIDKYVIRFGPSMEDWLNQHHDRIFYFHYDHQNFILDYFDNFICDYTGIIDYVRTAGRMMYCDRFDENQKFMIACTYFFEDDIRRLWPSVLKNMVLSCIDFTKSPQLYYWICCLRNELDKIPFTEIKGSIENVMLDVFMSHNRPSIEYFWNRMPSQNRSRKALYIYHQNKLSFARFILPKLDDQQLEEFVNAENHKLMSDLLKSVCYDERLALSVWMHIRKAINVDGFTKLVVKMLQSELMVYSYPGQTTEVAGDLKHGIWLDLCCEIWISASENFKRSAIVELTSNERFSSQWIVRINVVRPKPVPYVPKEFKFLSTFLSNATSTERKRFWFNGWIHLIEIAPCIDLAKIMKLCFENEDEIVQFKENTMANSSRVYFFCRMLLFRSFLDELNDFVNFLCSDIRAARGLKQRMLRLAFLGAHSNDFNEATMRKIKEFNSFIEDAFANVDLSTKFKSKLVSAPKILTTLSQLAFSVPLEQLVEFIDTFVSTEKTLLEIKALIIDELKRKAAHCKSSMSEFPFTPLLLWCLGSQEEVAKFEEDFL